MKRLLALFLAVICAASFLAGCGNRKSDDANDLLSDEALEDAKEYAKDYLDIFGKNNEDAEDAKSTIDSLNTGWPADKLPDGMPMYPDGDMLSVEVDGGINIQIIGTSHESLDDYIEKLSEAGWDVTENSSMENSYDLSKDDWDGLIMFLEDYVTITLLPKE